ncbi:hypothetical protein EF405_20275 [Cyclobacteriaceae bacterium YHN15]|jgi:hypothetical protein|nr:hypothetical protein EF405_20275 [Cyclobacteriaceae bacterium YHN15]
MQISDESFIKSLSDHLFWDVDKSKLEAQSSKSFIISRILEYGLTSDWKLALKFYGKNIILEVAKELKSLDPVALHFISAVFEVDLNEFRCYRLNQSAPNYWSY